MSCTSAPRSKWATSSSEWDLVASSPTSEHFYSGVLSILTPAVTAGPVARHLTALRDLQAHHDQYPLRLGDLVLALQRRWGGKLPLLTQRAGLSYHRSEENTFE